MRYYFISLAVFFNLFYWSCGERLINTHPQTTAKPDSTENQLLIYDQYADLEYIFKKRNDTTYVINFWATWCKPCVEEMPYFEQLHESYKGQKVRIILVSLDFKKQIDTRLIPFIKERNLQPQVLVLTDPDANSWISRVDEAWEGAIPVTIIYKGERRKFVDGQFSDYEELRGIVESFLKA